MTVRLLAALGQYPANAIVTFATAVETSLVAEKLASTDLTGGVVYQAPVDAGRAGEAARWVTDADGNPVDLLLPGAAGRGGAAAVVGAAGVAGARGVVVSGVPQAVQTADLRISRIADSTLTLPNPYPAQANAPVHPAVLYFPSGWNGYNYWMAYTPYPGANSDYENPTVAASQDGETWEARGRQPLVDKPANGYNADTHLFMSPDGLTMYLAFRERLLSNANNLKVMHTTDGVNWSSPVTILSGAFGTQDFGSPSIWWNGTGWTLISHNLDAAAPWPIQRRISATADVYGSWGTASTVTFAAASGRAWWHSYIMQLPSGQVVGLFQDNNSSSGASGFLYWAESADGGATFAQTQPCAAGAGDAAASTVRNYRSCFVLRENGGGVEADIFIGRLSPINIIRCIARSGRMSARNEYLTARASLLSLAASLPPHALWADTFNRADSATTLGAAASGGTYTVSGTWGINSNRAYPVANGRVLAAVGAANHEASVRMVDMTTGVQQWLIARATDASNYWRAGCPSPNASGLSILVIQSVVAGSVTINREIGAVARGDVLSMRCIGNAIEVLVNGILTHREVTTTSLSGASVGLQANVGANTFYDDFVAVAL